MNKLQSQTALKNRAAKSEAKDAITTINAIMAYLVANLEFGAIEVILGSALQQFEAALHKKEDVNND